jgi:DNA-binding IclR family transcriptional regulator
MEDKAYYKVASLERGLKVLELLGEKGSLSVSEVAAHLGMHRSAAHRFLATLKELGYVVQNSSLRYHLSFRLFELGMAMVNALGIRHIARPFLEELAQISNETVNLGHWDGKEIVYIDKVKSREVLLMDLAIGTRVPAYCSAMGKAILAFRATDEQRAFVNATPFEPLTPKTNTDPQKFLLELARIRDKGFAVDEEEMVSGIRCLAAPVFHYGEYPEYAVSLSGPTSRLPDDQMARLSQEVKRVSKEMSRRLGQNG